MALSDPYVTTADFKARLNITGSGQDTVITQAILAASRHIENVCGQVFNQSAPATVRYATATHGDILDVPPLVSVAELATDSGARTYPTVWETTDYDLYPFDAAGALMPYTQIRRAPTGSLAWPSTARGVRITGVFGWPAVPAPVVQATMREAERLWALARAPLGLAGAGELQTRIGSRDADVTALLGPYRVMAV